MKGYLCYVLGIQPSEVDKASNIQVEIWKELTSFILEKEAKPKNSKWW